MILSLIVAASDNNAIGKNNQLPWHLPADLRFFKNTTWGMPVIMGRKTFESMNNKPLAGRFNIVITRQENWEADGAIVATSFDEAIAKAAKTDCREAFIIGGGEIFSLALESASNIYLTRVHTKIEGDVFFPAPNKRKWQLVHQRSFSKDGKHAYDLTFEKWERIVHFDVE